MCIVGSSESMSSPCVKLVVVYLDQKLFFGYHVDELCSKAERKLAVSARLTRTIHATNKCYFFIDTYCHSSSTARDKVPFCSKDKVMKKTGKIQK